MRVVCVLSHLATSTSVCVFGRFAILISLGVGFILCTEFCLSDDYELWPFGVLSGHDPSEVHHNSPLHTPLWKSFARSPVAGCFDCVCRALS